MKVISGCIIEKDKKILMVQEGLEHCYGQWNYPAGHVNEFEKITDAAIREVKEETGLDVKLKGVLPIYAVDKKYETHIIIRFVAEIIGGEIKFDKKEILDAKWFSAEDIKNMKQEELRNYDLAISILNDYTKNNLYTLEIFNDNKFF